jgi:hypothetical protein
MPLKVVETVGAAFHWSDQRCDEVTHIARSVSFDYCSISAQRDSIGGKHGFRSFNLLLTGFYPGVRTYRFESYRAKGIPMQLPSIVQGDSPTRLLQGAAAGACDPAHRLQLGRLGKRRDGKGDDAEKRYLRSRVGPLSELTKERSTHRSQGQSHPHELEPRTAGRTANP